MASDPPIRVLLVEDNPGDARLIKESLHPSRFEVRMCDRLAELRPTLAAGPVDIILLDLGLPDGSGLDSFHQAASLAPGVPIVVLSGLSDEDVAVKAVREGAQDYLVKGRLDDDPLPRIVRHTVERRRSDEALRRSEARFRAAIEAGPDAFFILEALRDASGRACAFTLRDMNSRAAKLMGATIEQLSGRPLEEWDPCGQGASSLAQYSRVVETRETIEEELSAEGPDGGLTWTLRQIFPLADGVAVVVRDITTRKRLEERLLQTQKMEAVGQLAAGVAHDFRNLVAAIQAHLAHSRRLLPADHPAVECLNHIGDAAEQAGGIAGSLLTFTRSSHARKRPVNLPESVEQAVGLLRHSLPATILVQTDIADPEIFVNADGTQLQQVIMNLALNARDAMPHGGTLTLSVGRAQDDSTVKPGPEGLARVTVRDTGTGMSPEVIARIFEPYYTTKPRGQGTGLGLSIIHGIVTDHGGSIAVDSRPGAGAAFTLVFPAVAAPVAVPVPTMRPPAALLIDPNLFVREVVASMLASMNFEVLQASDYATALRLAKGSGRQFELVVAAAVLPDSDGPGCIRRIREATPVAHAILVVAGGETAAPTEGECGILNHPFRRADLVREIDRLRGAGGPVPG